MALCYNRAQTTDPPTTLDAVLNQASQGKGIAIDTGFLSSVWGISALGGTLFNSIDQFMLEAQPLSRWLSWLKNAQQTPNVYIDNRREILFDLFAAGNVAYFPCWTFEIPALQKKLNNQLGIAVLPGSSNSALLLWVVLWLLVQLFLRSGLWKLNLIATFVLPLLLLFST